MTEEELRKAMMNAAPKPSLEIRLEWLEADASAQRTAILKLERAFKSFAFHCCTALAVYAVALVVLLT
jgi:hypothetical protein